MKIMKTVCFAFDDLDFVIHSFELVGLELDMSFRSVRADPLIDNFYSTKREICCYTEYGHRRPPLGKVYLRRETYTPGNTGCPFYQKNAEDHGRKPVGESVPAEGWKKGLDMICSEHGNKAECAWGISLRISCCPDPEILQKDIERGSTTIG
jgi:hypothetical protein